MSADAPRKDERNARRVITAGAGIVFAVAGSAFVGWLGGPSILLRPSPADAEVSPASAIGFAICAAGLVAWAGERFRAAAWCGAAVSLLGAVAAATAAFPASPAGAETGGPGALLRGVPPFAACAFVVAGLVSFFGAREVVGHAEARRGSRIVAGGAALAVHSVGAAALLQRIFTGPSDPPILVAPYAAVGSRRSGPASVRWSGARRSARRSPSRWSVHPRSAMRASRRSVTVRIVCIRSRFQRSDSCRSSGRRKVRGPRSSPAERAALLHPVVISARDPEEIEKQALDADARVVFSKPLDHEVLLRQIAGELH
jgi:hypothetical protein